MNKELLLKTVEKGAKEYGDMGAYGGLAFALNAAITCTVIFLFVWGIVRVIIYFKRQSAQIEKEKYLSSEKEKKNGNGLKNTTLEKINRLEKEIDYIYSKMNRVIENQGFIKEKIARIEERLKFLCESKIKSNSNN